MAAQTAFAIAALCITQIIGWGATFYLPAVIGNAIAVDLGAPSAVVMAGPTVMLVAMAAVSWPLGRVFHRYGARLVMMAGSLAGAIGLALLATAWAIPVYALAWLIIGLGGAAMLTTAAQIAVAEVAKTETRRALGILLLAGGLTPSLFWPLTALLESVWGWRATTLGYAGLMLMICLPLHALCLARASDKEISQKAGGPAEPIDPVAFALAAVSFAANGFVTWGFSLTIILLLSARGLAPAEALMVASAIGVLQLGARLIDFAVSRYWSALATAVFAAALFPVSFILLLSSSGLVPAVIFVVIYSLAGGLTAVARASIPLELFAPRAYAQASARLAVPLNLSFAAAPPVFAAIIAGPGPEVALWLSLALSFVGLCALCLLTVHCSRRIR